VGSGDDRRVEAAPQAWAVGRITISFLAESGDASMQSIAKRAGIGNWLFVEAARDRLEREGLRVIGVAATSAEALRRAEELRPEVVLVDVILGRPSRRRSSANAPPESPGRR
jgi:hypothetical protein